MTGSQRPADRTMAQPRLPRQRLDATTISTVPIHAPPHVSSENWSHRPSCSHVREVWTCSRYASEYAVGSQATSSSPKTYTPEAVSGEVRLGDASSSWVD